MDVIKQRFLADRVMTATPAQRIVMLYDRLVLDLARARTEPETAGSHLDHAAQIIAELRGSLDATAGGPADNLATIYDYWLREIVAGRLSDAATSLTSIEANVWTLREAWVTIAAQPVIPSAEPVGMARTSWTA